MYKLLIAPTCFLAASAVFAADKPINNAPSYDFAQVSLVQTEFADIDMFTPKGFEFKASREFGMNFFGEATYFMADDKTQGVNMDVDRWKVALGYIHQFSNRTVLDGKISYGEIDIKINDSDNAVSAGTEYFTGEANIRHMITNNLEVYGGLEWQKWDEGSDQKAYKLGTQYFWDSIAVGGEYTKFSDSEVFAAFVRYSF
ncbi:hypothetical protein NQT74_05410 [Alteromonas stellipolaris]|uniref:hypothetical protein n=1 Tax=Alteromonas stellipolaris TaxID=233316 RepID=UPI002117D118|nr:hypothetical protein [Alteromonas stellipolaris]MCQ8848008.1 hypothetical protein [Alteromonas stellipolaris]